MIKKSLSYQDFRDGEDVEVTIDLRFAYTPPAIRLYEQQNPGAKFFVDLNKATSALSRYMKNKNLSFLSTEQDNLEQNAELLPLLTDPDINEFMLRIVPCMYMEVYEGIRLQSEETWAEANESLWMMQLVNITFFMEIFTELNSMAIAQSKARGIKKNEGEALERLSSTEPSLSLVSTLPGQKSST